MDVMSIPLSFLVTFYVLLALHCFFLFFLIVQILLFLSSCLKGTHKDGEAFSFLLTRLIGRLHMESVAVGGMMARSNQSEVLLLILRFFNIIMSRKRMRGDKTEVSHVIVM